MYYKIKQEDSEKAQTSGKNNTQLCNLQIYFHDHGHHVVFVPGHQTGYDCPGMCIVFLC